MAQAHLPRGDTIRGGLGPLTPVNNQEDAMRAFLEANLMETVPPLSALFSTYVK